MWGRYVRKDLSCLSARTYGRVKHPAAVGKVAQHTYLTPTQVQGEGQPLLEMQD